MVQVRRQLPTCQCVGFHFLLWCLECSRWLQSSSTQKVGIANVNPYNKYQSTFSFFFLTSLAISRYQLFIFNPPMDPFRYHWYMMYLFSFKVLWKRRTWLSLRNINERIKPMNWKEKPNVLIHMHLQIVSLTDWCL